MILTPAQLHILQHSLGCDRFGQSSYRGGDGPYHRNRYVSDPTPDLLALVDAELMADRGSHDELTGGMHCYRVTPAGIAAMRAQSPVPPKLTAGQQRYREWLRADCGLSFMDWLDERARGRRRAARYTTHYTTG